jgi:hypothetical protein
MAILKTNEKLQEVIGRAQSLLGVADLLLKQSQSMRSQTARLLGNIQRISSRRAKKRQAYRGLPIDEFPPPDHRGRMDSTRNPVSIEFLRTEVEATSVFAKIARDTTDREKKLRNVKNARTGYDTLLHFLKQLRLTPNERDEIRNKVSDLRRQLVNLGERL